VLLNIKQAAKALQVSPHFVYGLVGSRLIRHERHGKGKRAVIRIPEEALEEYRRSVTVTAETPAGEAKKPARRPRVKLRHLNL
jgi:excisionase family DNA binding protein